MIAKRSCDHNDGFIRAVGSPDFDLADLAANISKLNYAVDEWTSKAEKIPSAVVMEVLENYRQKWWPLIIARGVFCQGGGYFDEFQ